ncbi:beta-glucan synthesis-associated [Syncephalis plumigaleata]|nr:beta-glucan synthesis-associated [Syncephalis plumigaleata]
MATPRNISKAGKGSGSLPRWLIIIAGILLALGVAFLAIAFPILKNTIWKDKLNSDGTGVSGGSNPSNPGNKWVDPDTPQEARRKRMEDNTEYQLVFSDEFNQDGRNFRPGQDKIWEALDLWNWQTGDMEYYHPDQATTKDGTLRITIEKKQIGQQRYASAMIQTWNKFCFRGGYLEARVSLPGSPTIPAFWPAIWTMGNLARAAYGGSTDGLWPYSYDSCDLGVQKGQGINAGYSKLAGQRLNKCLCSDQDTPSPGIGRGAPEIDLLEGAAKDGGNNGGATVSQSHQFAPFDADYVVNPQYFVINNATSTYKNTYSGSELQQMVSAKTKVGPEYFEGKAYQNYAFQYEPGAKGYVRWYIDENKKATIDARAVAPNSKNGVGQRLISEEPMYIIMNLAMSTGFGEVDEKNAPIPSTMHVDYIRIYQHPDKIDVTCDPKDRPTAKYIKEHPKLYNDPGLRAFNESGYPLPEYSLNPQCKS